MPYLRNSLLIFFIIGLLLGLSISPWADRSPFQAVQEPIRISQAQTIHPKAITVSTSSFTPQTYSTLNLHDWFRLFEGEQQHRLAQRYPPAPAATHPPAQTLNIALLGDSMVETMGANAPNLVTKIKQLNSQIAPHIFNYGVGAQTIASAPSRLTQPFDRDDRSLPSLLSLRADIVIVESFAYNPMPSNISEYQRILQEILQQLKQTESTVFLLAPIAPLHHQFTVGPNGANLAPEQATSHAKTIQEHIILAIATAQKLGIPIIDAYHPSLTSDGSGTPAYVSEADGIHPSVAGHDFTAGQITTILNQSGLF